MACKFLAGYSGLYRPPTEDLCKYGTALYCVTEDPKRTLIVVALNPTFFLDLYRIIKHPQYQKLVLIVPTVDCVYISDIYNLYTEVTVNLEKEFVLICPETIPIATSDEFLTHVKVMQHARINLLGDDQTNLTVSVDYNHLYTPITRSVWDIILTTPMKRIFFSFYMSEEKLYWLKEHRDYFDEVHMPFTNITYGGASYMEIRRLTCTGIIPYIRVHSFRTDEERAFCQSHAIPYGGLIYRDLIR